MSSAGQIVGGIVGAVVGFVVGGPAGALKGAYLGMTVGGIVDPPKGPVIRGPRLDDLSVQTATYGAFIPRLYGTTAIHGNVFWVKGDRLTEVKVVTESGGKGGPTQTNENFEYFATFAVGLCEGPIESVRRIWIGGQLWYDAGQDPSTVVISGDTPSTIAGKTAKMIANIISSTDHSKAFTLYKGNDTQLADPIMQADKGVANVPAYRGLAYIVFDNLPLKNYSNSLMGAQVKVEVVKSATFAGPRLIDSVDIPGYPVRYYPSPAMANGEGVITVFGYDPFNPSDKATLNISYAGDLVNTEASFPTKLLSPQISSTGLMTTAIGYLDDALVWWPEYSSSYAIQNGARKVLPWGDIGFKDTANAAGNRADIADALTGEAGRFIIGVAFCNSEQKILITTGAIARATTPSADKYFVLDTALNIIASGAISDTTANIWSVGNATTEAPNGGPALDDEQNIGWITGIQVAGYISTRYYFIDSAGVMQISTSIESNMPGIGYLATAYDDGIFYVVARNSTVGRVYRYTAFPTVTGATANLGSIVSSECLKSKLLVSADIDVTELTDSVRGYRIGALGAIRAGLDPLRAAWPFDVVQSGYKINFKKRGGASVATITAGELDAHAAGDAPGVSVTDSREMDLILPYKVGVKYLDTTREYDNNEQYAERLNTDAVNESSIELPIVFTATEAAGKAETLLYMYWLERYDVAFKLPPAYAHLEPGDVITINATYATYSLRLTSVQHLPDGRLECQAKYNSASIYTPAAQGTEGASVGATLTLSGPSAYQLLDIPMLRDVDNVAGFPVAMTGYLAGWPGGVLFRSEDAGETWLDLVGFVSPGTVMGYATTTLTAHGGTVYDFASSLTVRLYQGTLSSVTEAQLFAAQNWFAYGKDDRWEIIAARTATLQADGSYILRDFLRGQLGTEWATGLHAVNDSIVRLNAADIEFVNVNASTIGSERNYRGITAGKSLDSDSSRAFTYRGVNLECLNPVHATGDRHPTTNDWTLTWVRRTRFAGWRDLVDATLGETTESYEVDIFSSSAYTTLKRTLTSATPTVAYTSANQVTDFGANQATLYLKIYQLSSVVGRGYPLTVSITR